MKLLVIALVVLTARSVCADTQVIMCDEAKFVDGDREFLVETTIPGEFKTLEGIAMALMIQGGLVENKAVSTNFSPQAIRSSSHFKGAQPLVNYFRGARIEKGIIILSFTEDAMRYLNNTASIQQILKGSLEGTLKLNFPTTKGLLYEIDGEIVEDWDA